MKTLFDAERLDLDQAIQLTLQSLHAHASDRHLVIAYSGGKDSTAAVTCLHHLLTAGLLPRVKSLSVIYADTRLELPPLQISALAILHALGKHGVPTQIVTPQLDERFYVYMLGRGVPPPKNRFRWCTPQLKIEPMHAALKSRRDALGEKLLMITGVRIGERAVRDQRIALSCSRDDGECGQGWLQVQSPLDIVDTLAPLLHWRTCHVWEWLSERAPHSGFPTAMVIADCYGGMNSFESLAEQSGRTGCIACPLASKDVALERILQLPQWAYLSPLRRLRPLHQELQLHSNRLRKDGTETRKDGSMVKNPGRVGPLKLQARRHGLAEVLRIQRAINDQAAQLGRPELELIGGEERQRILELIEANTWPNGWTGEELSGDIDVPDYYADGTMMPLLFDADDL